jgi:hypothetical protein
VRPRQVVVTACLRISGHLTTAFPAFLDSGNNFNFSIAEEHCKGWLGLDPASLEKIGEIRINQEPATLRRADVLLFQNVNESRAVTGRTYELNFSRSDGVAITPQPARHLPILGIRGIFRQQLTLTFHGKSLTVSLND